MIFGGVIINHKHEGTREEGTVAQFKALFRHPLGGLRVTLKTTMKAQYFAFL
jgi:hypothetical protein